MLYFIDFIEDLILLGSIASSKEIVKTPPNTFLPSHHDSVRTSSGTLILSKVSNPNPFKFHLIITQTDFKLKNPASK